MTQLNFQRLSPVFNLSVCTNIQENTYSKQYTSIPFWTYPERESLFLNFCVDVNNFCWWCVYVRSSDNRPQWIPYSQLSYLLLKIQMLCGLYHSVTGASIIVDCFFMDDWFQANGVVHQHRFQQCRHVLKILILVQNWITWSHFCFLEIFGYVFKCAVRPS